MTDANQVLMKSLEELQSGRITSIEGKKRFLGILGLDPQWAYSTKEEIEDIKKSLGSLSDAQVQKGLAAQESFDRLRESVKMLKDTLGAELGPVMTQISDSIRQFVSTHVSERPFETSIGSASANRSRASPMHLEAGRIA
jgi:hypothetical protein